MKPHRKIAYTTLATLLLSFSSSGYASLSSTTWQSIAASYGHNHKDKIDGGRLAYRFLPETFSWKYFSLYFDASAAYWHTDLRPHNKKVWAFAFAPALRFHLPITSYLEPFIEASIGPAVLTKKQFGQHKFGSKLMFQDMLGGGITFGPKKQFEISYHYLHYSNGSWAKPNNGINIQQLFTFAIRF